jgi:hypothetical protein
VNLSESEVDMDDLSLSDLEDEYDPKDEEYQNYRINMIKGNTSKEEQDEDLRFTE